MKYIVLFLIPFFFIACNEETVSNEIYADIETENCLATQEDDAADDPAFWFNHTEAASSFILGSNKLLGLEVYDLEGKRLAHYPTGRLNNIDVVQDITLAGQKMDIVAGSNRDHDRIDVWQINQDATIFNFISDTGMSTKLEGVYGFCLWKDKNQTYAFINNKEGDIEQWKLIGDSLPIQFELVHQYKAESQIEGMVVDAKSARLYVGEENQGIYVYNLLDPAVKRYKIKNSGEENKDLAYDIEGLTIYNKGNQNLLLASSQGNNRYAVFDINDEHSYKGYFQIGSSTIDGSEETDGIDVVSEAIGDIYPEGIFICQDGFNKDKDGNPVPQNFKITDWRKIKNLF